MEDSAREFALHMIHPGTEHWKTLGILIGYLKGKETKIIFIRNPKALKAVIFFNSN